MRCVELFAGAGGAALGLEAAGIDHLALCELNPDACGTLRAAGLGPVMEGDVRGMDWRPHHGADLLWASFPCQAFSSAGERRGARDDRNGWPWTVAAMDAVGPAWFIGENVPGLTYHTAECGPRTGPMDCPGCYLGSIIMRDLRARFPWVDVWKLDAADYGVPQHRRRIFLVAGPRPVRKPRPTHCDPTLPLMLATGYQPWVSLADALGLAARVIGGGRNPTATPGDVRTFRDITDEPSTTLAAARIGNAGPWVVGDGRRRLTLAECARLQSFPPGHPFQGTKAARYQQIGNAVPPPVARVIGAAFMEASHA